MGSQKNKEGVNVGISWCDYSANIWWGCTKVHAGCDHCYAETTSSRWGKNVWGNHNPRQLVKGFFNDLKRYQKLASDLDRIDTVFVGSMMDIFEKPMPIVSSSGEMITYKEAGAHRQATTDDFRQVFFKEISDNKYPNLFFLLLTKRPSNINKYIPKDWMHRPPKNVMFGTSIADQDSADTLIPQLLEVHGRRFLSIEPQIASINLEKHLSENKNGIHWIIQGGESGAKKRPFKLEWANMIRIQCEHFKVPYFFKQIDKVQNIPDDLLVRQFPSFK